MTEPAPEPAPEQAVTTQQPGQWTTDELAQLAEAMKWKPGRLAEFVKELEQLALDREERYARHKALIERDATLDDRLRGLYLSREIWDNYRIADEAGMKVQRVNELRGGRVSARRPRPHPSMFPPVDFILGYVPGLRELLPGNFAGPVRLWVVQRGSHDIDREAGSMYTVPWRVGRPRANRPTLSRPHVPGTPRRGKKSTEQDDPE